MARQSLFTYGSQKLPNSAKYRKLTAITPVKVIQGHKFCKQSAVHVRLPISELVNNTNLPPILYRFRDMADYMSNFR